MVGVKMEGNKRKEDEEECPEEEDKEKASLVKCTLQGLCITCRLQSFTFFCFAYLPDPLVLSPYSF